ncbi:hypothetical protein L3Q82_003750 [Scortum barcoo]|uniref:Uncharacterized protein n=1 Tax=Scortum barcoo TaxID=214431 RepID=A0ACB8X672_9TELE|nr:hypothetical protein L3Q82_003750 [Scortum barcoo]
MKFSVPLVCRSQCDSLRDRASSLELHASSLTSDLSRLQGLLSRSRRESASFLSACALLSGALRHAHGRLQTLCGQKTLLCRRLTEKEALEEEVRRLVGALGGDEEEEGRRSRAVRRWRRSVCVVLAVRRWRSLANQTMVLFRMERGGRATAVCVCGETTATREGQTELSTDKDADDGGREGVCARWLRSKSLSSVILSCMADLQGALTHADVMSAARSGLSRLLDHLLDQSGAASRLSPCKVNEDSLSRLTPPHSPTRRPWCRPCSSTSCSSANGCTRPEVERRSFEAGGGQSEERTATGKRGELQDGALGAVQQCVFGAPSGAEQEQEQEAQSLVQEQAEQLHTLQRRVNTHTAELTSTQHTLSQTTQKERKQLEERLRRAEDELRDATRHKDCLISSMKAAEMSYKEVRESLVQSSRSLSAQPRPLLLPREHLEMSGAESIMGAPEVAALQSLLAAFAQLCHTCTSRIDWLEQEVSAHRSHVTALRSELQDACLRDNLAYVPVIVGGCGEASSEFPPAAAALLFLVSNKQCDLVHPSGVQRPAAAAPVSNQEASSSGHVIAADWTHLGGTVHALEKLQFQAQQPSSCGPVEVALPGLVFDLSSLVLYGAQALPVRLKILLDRLYSILTPEQVGHILHTLGWSLGDYVRGYMLQYPNGKVLDCWLMVTPEEELLILKQFLRFGETRPIVELMWLQLSDPELNPAHKSSQSNINTFIERNRGTPGVLRNMRAGIERFRKNNPPDHNDTVHHFENLPLGQSLLFPFHFPGSSFHCLVPPNKELLPPGKPTQCLRKPSGTKLTERQRQEGGRKKQESDLILPPALKIKVDPDKPNPAASIWHQNPRFNNDQELDLRRGVAKQENTSSLSPPLTSSFIPTSYSLRPSVSTSPPKISQKLQGSSSYSLSPLPSFFSSFLCPLPSSSFSSSLHPLPTPSSSLHPLPSSICSLTSLSPTGGRKGRVCCGVCGKSFYDKGTLKIHYNAVHLKIKHRCTVAGCTMVFS